MKTSIEIRQVTDQDYELILPLVKKSFAEGDRGYMGEAELVQLIKDSTFYVPELALVAMRNQSIVGFILLSKIKISTTGGDVPSLILAPVAIDTDHQKSGVGGSLIHAAHDRARALGWQHVFLLGHPSYYPKFGYQPARNFNISFPNDNTSDACMAIELVEGSLSNIDGAIEYSEPFYQL